MRAHRIVIGLVSFALFGAFGRLGAQADGAPRWAYKAGDYIYSSPAIASDGTIYVGGADRTSPPLGRLLALTRDGALRWQFPAKPTDPRLRAVESSPVLSADERLVYFGCDDGTLYALDAKTGAVVGTFVSGAAELPNSPTIGPDGTVYIISSDLVLHALTADLQRHRWPPHPAGALISLDTAVAIGVDGTVYFGAPDQQVYAVDQNGAEKWHTSVGAALLSSPAIGPDGTIYFGAGDNNLVAIAPDGAVKWRFPAGDLILSAPSLAADGTIYFGSLDGRFYAVNPDHSTKWSVNLHTEVISTAAVRADGTIIFGANDNFVHALNPADGTTKWTYPTGDPVQTSPAIAADGSIYVGSLDGKLHAIYGSGSPLSTVSSWPMLNHDASHSGRAIAATAGAYLINLSTIAQAGGNSNLIAGFVVQGSAAKRFLIRGVGPSLTSLGVPGALPDPAISLVSAAVEVAANDNWSSTDANFLAVLNATNGVAFPLGTGEKDAALVATLAPGNFTAVVKATDAKPGLALVEVYDLAVTAPTARLINISTRAQSGSGASVLSAGFVIGGQGTLRVLLRAIGPGLLQFPGVSGVLAQPAMRVYDANQKQIGGNAGWSSGGLTEDLAAAARMTGAFALPPRSADSVTVMTLTPGSYTIQVAGAEGATGEALVEVYVMP